MPQNFSRRYTPPTIETFEWLILIGNDCREAHMRMPIPCEKTARRRLNIPKDVPILIGRP